MKSNNRSESEENRKVYRPWGNFVSVDNSLLWKIKKIEVVGTENEDVIIFGDINENDMIVVSTLNTGYEGMELTPMQLDKVEEL